MSRKDTVKAIKKVSRKQNKLPQGKVVSPNKKEYKRKPKVKNPDHHNGWPDWWMD